MAALEGNVSEVLKILPEELVSKVDFLIVLLQALGGLFILYFFFFAVRFYFLRKQTKILKNIQKDIIFIKNKLKSKRK